MTAISACSLQDLAPLTPKEIQVLWPDEAIQRILDEVLDSWNALDLRASITWSWNSRLRTSMGRAFFYEMRIELNPHLLARFPEEFRPVLVHEAGHLVVQRLHGNQPPHGRIWKAYMRKAGVSTRATLLID